MQQEKKWWQSKAVIGGLIAVLAAIAGAFGVEVSAEQQASLADYAIAISGGIGGALAVYGRIKADTKLKK